MSGTTTRLSGRQRGDYRADQLGDRRARPPPAPHPSRRGARTSHGHSRCSAPNAPSSCARRASPTARIAARPMPGAVAARSWRCCSRSPPAPTTHALRRCSPPTLDHLTDARCLIAVARVGFEVGAAAGVSARGARYRLGAASRPGVGGCWRGSAFAGGRRGGRPRSAPSASRSWWTAAYACGPSSARSWRSMVRRAFVERRGSRPRAGSGSRSSPGRSCLTG